MIELIRKYNALRKEKNAMEINEIARNHELLFRFIGMTLSTMYFGGMALLVRRTKGRIPQVLGMIGAVVMVSYFWWLNTLQ